MGERTSKALLSIEALLLLVPVSLFTLFGALWMLPMYWDSSEAQEPWQTHAVSAFTVLGVALQLCGWRLIVAFLLDGRAGIGRVAGFYVGAASLGAALAVLAGLMMLLLQLELALPDALVVLAFNYVALPALIPFLHVMLEWRRSRVNAPAERRAGGAERVAAA